MKNHFISIAFLLFPVNFQAQNYQINFTGSGESTSLENVEVFNLTRETSVLLNSNEVLHLANVVSVDETDFYKNSLHVFPNPMKETSIIEFYNSNEGQVSMEMLDVTGRWIYRNSWQLGHGKHSFLSGGLNSGIYKIIVSAPGMKYTGTLVSTGIKKGSPDISYLGNNEYSPGFNTTLKNSSNLVQMEYNDGERILLKGKSGNFSRVITFVPTGNQTIDFEFIECTDGDINHYPIVTIGDQTWMAESLKTSKYNDQTNIQYTGSNMYAWQTLNIGAYTWYDNVISNRDTYGTIYNWHAAGTGKLCPLGWRMPAESDWEELKIYLGGDSIAGGKLKQTDASLWNIPNTGADNETGFTGLPGGRRTSEGFYENLGSHFYLWGSESNVTDANLYFMQNETPSLLHSDTESKRTGASVRCIKSEADDKYPYIIAKGSYPDLAVDNNGNVHVVYGRNDTLFYKMLDVEMDEWTVEVSPGNIIIEKIGELGIERSDPDIVIDSHNHPHVYAGSNYAYWNGSAWIRVRPLAGKIRDTQLAIDKNDNAFLVHRGGNNTGKLGIIMLPYGADSWIPLKDPDSDSGSDSDHIYPDIAVSYVDNKIWIVQRRGLPSSIMVHFSADTGKTWTSEPVSTDWQESPHIVIDKNNDVFITTALGRFYKRVSDNNWVLEGRAVMALAREQPVLTVDHDNRIYCTSWGGKYNIRVNGIWRGQRQLLSLTGNPIGFVEAAGYKYYAYAVWEEGTTVNSDTGTGAVDIVFGIIKQE